MSNKILKLNLDDLEPQASSFELSTYPDKKFHLEAYTLQVQLWAQKTFGKERLGNAVAAEDIGTLVELAHYILDDEGKKTFPTVDDLIGAVVNYKDRRALVHGVLDTLGLSQPVLKKLSEDMEGDKKKEGKQKSPVARSTGANSST